jgi:hypothetical protein
MQPTNPLLDQIMALVAADTTQLGSATALKIHLAIANFVPSPTLVVGSFTEATFTGYVPLLVGTGTQISYVDPVTGLRTIELKAPAGGLNFKATAGTGLPQTIFGFYVTDNGSATLFGSQLLTTPVVLTASGQGFDIPPPRLAFLNTSPQ